MKLTEFILPSNVGNLSAAPVTGDSLQVTFYYTTVSDSENISFSKSGTLYTNKRFALVNTIDISSGFSSGSSAVSSLTVTNLNQPTMTNLAQSNLRDLKYVVGSIL